MKILLLALLLTNCVASFVLGSQAIVTPEYTLELPDSWRKIEGAPDTADGLRQDYYERSGGDVVVRIATARRVAVRVPATLFKERVEKYLHHGAPHAVSTEVKGWHVTRATAASLITYDFGGRSYTVRVVLIESPDQVYLVEERFSPLGQNYADDRIAIAKSFQLRSAAASRIAAATEGTLIDRSTYSLILPEGWTVHETYQPKAPGEQGESYRDGDRCAVLVSVMENPGKRTPEELAHFWLSQMNQYKLSNVRRSQSWYGFPVDVCLEGEVVESDGAGYIKIGIRITQKKIAMLASIATEPAAAAVTKRPLEVIGQSFRLK